MKEFFDAIKAGQTEIVNQILDAHPSLASAVNEGGTTAVQLAQYFGHHALAKAIAARVKDLDIFSASVIGDVDRVVAILEFAPHQIDALSRDGGRPLAFAAYFGHEALAMELLNRGASTTASSAGFGGVQAIHAAVAGRVEGIVSAILKQGCDVNAAQAGGFTALHGAAQNGDLAIVQMLLAAGADPTLATEDGQIARDLARESGHEAVVELLSSVN